MKAKRKLPLIVYSALTLFWAYYMFTNYVNLNPMYPESALFWCFLITSYLVAWLFLRLNINISDLASTDDDGRTTVDFGRVVGFKGMPLIAKILLIAPWAVFLVVVLLSSVFFNWEAYRDQLGTPTVAQFSSDVQAVDISQIPIVDEELAKNLADKKLGERPSLGSQVKLGDPTIQMVNGELQWVVPLLHSGLFQWLGNLEGTLGYITVSATNVNDVEYVEGHSVKYQPGSYLLHDLGRYTRFTSALFTGITDYSFELDDSGKPYWVITTYHNTRGFSLPEANGIIVVDATTGASTAYPLNAIPEWVDRVQPEDFIIRQIYNQGEYVRGFLNFSDREKYMPSQGHTIIYNNDRCYLFTGLTSVGTDESAIGFIMVDMVTKETIQYQMNGATEVSAMRSAQGEVQDLEYYASFPIILNIGGTPSYFMTLKDNEGLIKQYAYVSVERYSTVGVGDTISAALRDYQNALAQEGITGSGLLDNMVTEELTGTVLRIASLFDGTDLMYNIILEEHQNKIFTASILLSSELPLTQVGDEVTIKYSAMEEMPPIVSVIEFDNDEFNQN